MIRNQHYQQFFDKYPGIRSLCICLDTDPKKLNHLLQNPLYYNFSIPKKKGGKREILAPNSELMSLQRNFIDLVQHKCLKVLPKMVYGFVPAYKSDRRSIIANARLHIGKKHLLNIDIKNFFPSISIDQVYKVFRGSPFRYSENLSSALALLCCYQGALPVGAPSSPMLSNLFMIQLDKQISFLAESKGIVYSRYADDLSFSSDQRIEVDFVEEIRVLLRGYHLELNDKKIHFASSHQCQRVTGIKVNQRLNIDRSYLRELRAILFNIQKNGIHPECFRYFKGKVSKSKDGQLFLEIIRGRLEFVRQVRGGDDVIYRELLAKYKICKQHYFPDFTS
jgi:RNA-directed DNA polymerase